jgi:hypothetical protein
LDPGENGDAWCVYAIEDPDEPHGWLGIVACDTQPEAEALAAQLNAADPTGAQRVAFACGHLPDRVGVTVSRLNFDNLQDVAADWDFTIEETIDAALEAGL